MERSGRAEVAASRRGVVRWVALIAACVGLLSCSARPTSVVPDQTTAAQTTLEQIASAVVRRDRAAFDQQLSLRDPGFVRSSAELYDNLTTLPLADLEWEVHDRPRRLSAGRRAVLPDAWMQAVTVVWKLGSDSGPATHQLWWTFEFEGTRALLAGVTDSPGPRGPQPIWMLGPVRVSTVGAVTAVESRDAPVGVAHLADAAVQQARRRIPDKLSRRWNGRVVVEVPSSEVRFRQIAGLSAGVRPELAAITYPAGPDPGTAALRIVVNPSGLSGLPEDSAGVVLVHEVTHVLTQAADSPAPLWLVEGFADWVAYDVHRSAQPAAEAEMVARVRADGVPTALPANKAFAPTAEDANLLYVQSWLVCRYIAESFSGEDLSHLYLSLDQGRELNPSLENVLGLTGDAFTDGWQSYLEHLAAR